MKQFGTVTVFGMFVDEAIEILEKLPKNAEVRYLWHDSKNFNFDKIHGWVEYKVEGNFRYHPKPLESDISSVNFKNIDGKWVQSDKPETRRKKLRFSEFIINEPESQLCSDGKYHPVYTRERTLTVAELLVTLDNYGSDVKLKISHRKKDNRVRTSLSVENILFIDGIAYLKPSNSFRMDINDFHHNSAKIHDFCENPSDQICIVKRY